LFSTWDNNVFIRRESQQDEAFHFQNWIKAKWVKARLVDTGLHFEQRDETLIPIFGMVEITEGYKIKGLAYPGRDSHLWPQQPDFDRFRDAPVSCDGSYGSSPGASMSSIHASDPASWRDMFTKG